MWHCLQMLDERKICKRRNIKAKALFHFRVDIGSVRFICIFVCMHVCACVRACVYAWMYVFFHSSGH